MSGRINPCETERRLLSATSTTSGVQRRAALVRYRAHTARCAVCHAWINELNTAVWQHEYNDNDLRWLMIQEAK